MITSPSPSVSVNLKRASSPFCAERAKVRVLMAFVTKRPSYVADSESRMDDPDYGGPPSPFKRGIRVGSVRDGSVKYFIPDPKPAGGSSAAEGVAATDDGIIFGAEVGPRQVVRYQKK